MKLAMTAAVATRSFKLSAQFPFLTLPPSPCSKSDEIGCDKCYSYSSHKTSVFPDTYTTKTTTSDNVNTVSTVQRTVANPNCWSTSLDEPDSLQRWTFTTRTTARHDICRPSTGQMSSSSLDTRDGGSIRQTMVSLASHCIGSQSTASQGRNANEGTSVAQVSLLSCLS